MASQSQSWPRPPEHRPPQSLDLFVFAKRQGYTAENPIADVERAKERAGEIEILTVAETARLLECAEVETLPYWAIGAFAGLRSAEIERLEWISRRA